jgi:hypothetical protein
MVRFQVTFTQEEANALYKLSEQRFRSIRDQVRFLVIQELIREKLLENKVPEDLSLTEEEERFGAQKQR